MERYFKIIITCVVGAWAGGAVALILARGLTVFVFYQLIWLTFPGKLDQESLNILLATYFTKEVIAGSILGGMLFGLVGSKRIKSE
jgi:hypothetical protein